MDTISSNIQTESFYLEITDEILSVLSDFNFHTDTQFDVAFLKQQIVNIIRNKVERNTIYA